MCAPPRAAPPPEPPEGRAEERAAAKDQKRRQKAQHRANELVLQLGLSPTQTEALLVLRVWQVVLQTQKSRH